MNDRISPESKNTNTTSFDDAARIAEVESWLASQFDAAGRDVPAFEYTPRSITRLHDLATASKANTRAASIIASDLRLKASDYRSQAVRIREILEIVELALERLSPGAVRSVQVIANVANFLNLKDTEMSSFLIAMGDISLRKTSIEEERDKAKRESEVLLNYARKALAKLTFLKNILELENWRVKSKREDLAPDKEEHTANNNKLLHDFYDEVTDDACTIREPFKSLMMK